MALPKAPIDQVNYEKTQAAYKQVFEDADSFEEYVILMRTQQQHLMAAEWLF